MEKISFRPSLSLTMAELWIAVQKIPAEIQFNTIVMIPDEEDK